MKKIRIFYLKIFIFLVVKFSIYLNRRVFVMQQEVADVASLVKTADVLFKCIKC